MNDGKIKAIGYLLITLVAVAFFSKNYVYDEYIDTRTVNQVEFVKGVSEFREKYQKIEKSGNNEAAKSLVRIDRKNWLETLGVKFNNWTAVRSSLSTNSDGMITIYFTIQGNNTALDRALGNNVTLRSIVFPDDEAIYKFIATTKENQNVVISGKFFRNSSSSDYFLEKSATESGSMTSPEFEIEIDSIR